MKWNVFLYDGKKRLGGTLKCSTDAYIFELEDFKMSHLTWYLPFQNIQNITPYILFGIAKVGVVIIGKNDFEDVFIFDNQEDRDAFLKDYKAKHR